MRKLSVGWVVCLTALAALVMVLPLSEAADIACPTLTNGERCQGVLATCVGTGDGDNITEQVAGTSNVIVAGKSPSKDTLNDDQITLGDGNNTICAGWGDDTITVGDGTNHIYGGWGDDTIIVNTTTGNGINTIQGGWGEDSITVNGPGNAGNTIRGGQDDDEIVSPLGTIDGGPGEDTCSGGATEVACELD